LCACLPSLSLRHSRDREDLWVRTKDERTNERHYSFVFRTNERANENIRSSVERRNERKKLLILTCIVDGWIVRGNKRQFDGTNGAKAYSIQVVTIRPKKPWFHPPIGFLKFS
jgi:hypothetical protein